MVGRAKSRRLRYLEIFRGWVWTIFRISGFSEKPQKQHFSEKQQKTPFSGFSKIRSLLKFAPLKIKPPVSRAIFKSPATQLLRLLRMGHGKISRRCV